MVDIRVATPADVADVRALWEEFEREVPDPVGEQPVWSDVSSAARAAVADDRVLLASVDGRVVGFAWATPPERAVARLEYLHVEPGHRRRGIARRLVRAVAEGMAARGASDLVLEVVATNEAAQATWRALGFEPIEYRLAAPISTLMDE